jgi:hypothetical protein
MMRFLDLKPGNILIAVEDPESIVKQELADHAPEVVDATEVPRGLQQRDTSRSRYHYNRDRNH